MHRYDTSNSAYAPGNRFFGPPDNVWGEKVRYVACQGCNWQQCGKKAETRGRKHALKTGHTVRVTGWIVHHHEPEYKPGRANYRVVKLGPPLELVRRTKRCTYKHPMRVRES